MSTLEKEVEQYLVGRVEKTLNGMCLKWICPGFAGVPDRIVILPDKEIVFVELKRPAGGVVARRQEHWKKALNSYGFRVLLISSKHEVDAFVEQLEPVPFS